MGRSLTLPVCLLVLAGNNGVAFTPWVALPVEITPDSTLSPSRLQSDCSENVDEEAVEQWINEDSISECCKVLSDDDIVSRVRCDSEETRNFEECPESDEENLVTHQKLSHGDALVHTEALFNYLEQEDQSTPAQKMILSNLRSIIRRRVSRRTESRLEPMRSVRELSDKVQIKYLATLLVEEETLSR
ncbi:hypothetical protein AVEN_64893-1 [Araneus ventricosus]|uniref:Uncharacterized protein n=1 Tax=Araneus ventricosus TaxID=182803 RepID=A0A4Y2L2U2_ARAVE|nr:hypothetical protein AVEN_64893-1 [Araneus ventricosus]